MDNKIVRTPTRAEGGITDDEKKAMDAITKKWIDIAFRTDTIKPAKITDAINRLYAAAGLEKPRVIIVPSPRVMALAYGLSAGVWYLRKNGSLGDNATDNATYNATYNATRNATDNVTDNATRNATDNVTDNATYNATDNATDNVTDNATYNATYNATRNATDNVTDNATRNATDNATDKNWLRQLAIEFGGTEKNADLLLACIPRWWNNYQGGNMWAWSGAYGEAMRDVIGLKGLDCWDKWQAWEDATKEGGFRVMHEKFCIVSDFPKTLEVDSQNRPHSDTGPSHEWRDGWKLYHIDGIKFDEDLWTKITGKTMTAEEALKIEDIDQRRIAIRYMGADNMLKALGAELMDTGEPRIFEWLENRGIRRVEKEGQNTKTVFNELYKVAAGDIFEEDEYFLHYHNMSVDEEYISFVPHEIGEKGDADAAMAWKHNVTKKQYMSPDYQEA